MTRRYERLFGYGAPPLNYHDMGTWPHEVLRLYRRLLSNDHSVLAPLLKWDIEFLSNRRVMISLIKLKYSPDLPDKQCREKLREIAKVIAYRPRRFDRNLPYGDQLSAELESLSDLIEKHALLKIKNDRGAIQKKLELALRKPMLEAPKGEIGALVSDLTKEELLGSKKASQRIQGKRKIPTRKVADESPKREIVRLASALSRVINEKPRTRKARSWAIQAMADLYGVEPKHLYRAIAKENCRAYWRQ